MMLNAVEHRLSFAFLYPEKLIEFVNLSRYLHRA